MAIAKSASSVLQTAPGSEHTDRAASLPVHVNPKAEYAFMAGEKPYLHVTKDIINTLAINNKRSVQCVEHYIRSWVHSSRSHSFTAQLPADNLNFISTGIKVAGLSKAV